ncbi:hypothetical protein CRG98_012453 [Punica granatum]|uniref:Uncharacterized protein n=1 Tax=Punica granatum TaxID=22663 RepID=A0A2I0KF35_PUNGR|nr:hypothetical protein CRG98_012453 [Punica granatum]
MAVLTLCQQSGNRIRDFATRDCCRSFVMSSKSRPSIHGGDGACGSPEMVAAGTPTAHDRPRPVAQIFCFLPYSGGCNIDRAFL